MYCFNYSLLALKSEMKKIFFRNIFAYIFRLKQFIMLQISQE